jgi:transcriptional antiterminator RfaH
MDQWYVVYTRPREEHVAEENLVRQGFETYWPRFRKRSAHARRVQEVTASLFPRYLFSRFSLEDAGWRVIRSTRGVAGLVSQGFDPTPISEQLIDDIRSREDDKGYVVLGRQIELQKGQRIQLASEAFKGLEVVFEAKKDSDRVVALLGLLGREFKVSIPVSQVVPAAL